MQHVVRQYDLHRRDLSIKYDVKCAIGRVQWFVSIDYTAKSVLPGCILDEKKGQVSKLKTTWGISLLQQNCFLACDMNMLWLAFERRK